MYAHRSNHHESRKAVSIIQAGSKVGIVISFAHFGVELDVMILVVLQLATGFAMEQC